MRTKVNRVLLALTGLLLLTLGLAVLVGGLDLQRRWGFALPDSWPFTGPRDVLLTDADRTRYRDDDWWWPTVFAALGALVALLLWWLLAQLRGHRLRRVFVGDGDTLLRGRALEDILAAESEDFEGVDHARVTLTGRRGSPEARIVLGLALYSQPGAVVADLDAVVLSRARAAADLPALPTEARLGAVKHPPAKVM